MPKGTKILWEAVRPLILNKASAVDLDNKIIYLKTEEMKEKERVKLKNLGFSFQNIGKLKFMNYYVVPRGCSPVLQYNHNSVSTSLHCISDSSFEPAKNPKLYLVDENLNRIDSVDSVITGYTKVLKCGWRCKLKLFFRQIPWEYINKAEIAWLKLKKNLHSYDPNSALLPIGHLTAGNERGDFMLFSPFPHTGVLIKPGEGIIYISADYQMKKVVVVETKITGWALANIEGYLFYLPYSYEPGKRLAVPGYSGSVIRLNTPASADLGTLIAYISPDVLFQHG